MSLVALANHLAEKGRGDDKMLVHMTPGEVQGLQALALASGGSLTINPETGLVEAGWLKKMLPAIAGFALNFIAPGVGSAIGATLGGLSGAAGTAIAVGGITGLATGSLKQGLMAGLGAFGGASLASGLTAAGATGVEQAALKSITPDQIAQYKELGIPQSTLIEDVTRNAGLEYTKSSGLNQIGQGIQNLGNAAGRKAFMDTLGGTTGLARTAAMAGAPAIAAAMEPPEAMKMRPMDPGNINRFSFDPFSQTYTRLGSQPAGMASGGIVALAAGGAPANPYEKEIQEGQKAVPYATGTRATREDIGGIYQNLLGRAADPGGMEFYYASQFSPEQIRQNIMQSQEYLNRPSAVAPAPVLPGPTVPGSTGTDQTYGGDTTTPEYTAPQPQVTYGPAFQPTPQTVEQVRSAYEQGGGATRMPTITDIAPGERTYTQNAVVSLLTGYLQSNPNATYSEVTRFAQNNGIPEYQARAAYNEFRFSGLTGGSRSAYDFLMGRGANPLTPFTPTGEVMRPYAEAVLGMPVDKTKRKFIFDPNTRKYIPNPDYVAPPATGADTTIGSGPRTPRDPMGNLYTGLAASYFAANPDVQKAFETQVGGMTPEQYVQYHWNTFGKNEGRKGYVESQTAQPATPATPDGGESNADITPFNKGGIAMLAGAAQGGQFNLGGYSDGGRLLRGPGDGVSDSIPATIGNRQPARLADGEFVIPARIVSEIGNGSTEAGARKLYAMMDRVQRARAKTTGKGKVAKNTRADEYLPA